MSHDHYVAQTYLKHFGDDAHGGMLHAYRKSNGKYFRCWPKDVCREWDGDINRLLAHPELLGDFRRMVEPYWNASVDRILAGEMSYHDKFVVATYAANLMTCTPAWRRIGVSHHNQHYRARLQMRSAVSRRRGTPDELLEEGLEMLERGELALDTDPDYIKGLATKNLMQHAWIIYNQDWMVYRNDTRDPFITSDNPVALAHSGSPGDPVRRFLPLSPSLCLALTFVPHANPAAARITPQELAAGLERAPHGLITRASCTPALARHINRTQVQSAEELIFSPQSSDGIERLAIKYAHHRMDVEVVQFPSREDDSIIVGSILSVRSVRAGSS